MATDLGTWYFVPLYLSQGFGRGGCGFEDAAEGDIRAVCDTARNASGDMIDSGAGLRYSFKTGAVLKSFAGIDAHDRKSQFRLQFVEDRFAYSCLQSLDAAFYDSAYRVAVTFVRGYGLSELGRVGLCAHLDQSGMDSDAFEPQGLFGDTSGYHACRRLAGGSYRISARRFGRHVRCGRSV